MPIQRACRFKPLPKRTCERHQTMNLAGILVLHDVSIPPTWYFWDFPVGDAQLCTMRIGGVCLLMPLGYFFSHAKEVDRADRSSSSVSMRNRLAGKTRT
jgi:hypothetical protein